MDNYTIDDLKKDISLGMDIEFTYQGVSYGIYPFHPDGISIYVQNSDQESVYQTVDAMLDQFMLDGKVMKTVFHQIEITLH